MKKHSLIEHWCDVSMWWSDTGVWDSGGPYKDQPALIFHIAYERWTNDKELLTVEDGYEWSMELPEGSWQSARHGWIGPPKQ